MTLVESWRLLERRQEALDRWCFRYRGALRDLPGDQVSSGRYNVAGQLGLEIGHCLSVLRRLTELAAEDRRTLEAPTRMRRDHEAWMLTEAFYMFAWRALERVSERARPNPQECYGLKRRVAAGVRDVRNHLLEHLQEVAFETPNILWSDAASGPVLKALRSDDQRAKLPVDRGLFVNAVEFQDVLADALRVFLAGHGVEMHPLPPFIPPAADYAEILGTRTDEDDDAQANP